MMYATVPDTKIDCHADQGVFVLMLGAFLAAFSLEVFLIPNNLIDGGVVGVAMIFGKIFGQHLLPFFLVAFNIPFIYLAYKYIGKGFLIHMLVAVILFATSLVVISNFLPGPSMATTWRWSLSVEAS